MIATLFVLAQVLAPQAPESPIYEFLSGRAISQQGSFLQSGSGATLRTIESKLRDTRSVKDYGAVCDGVTNDATAFQNAINAGAESVTLPPGTCVIASTLTINNRSLFDLVASNTNITYTGGAGTYLFDIQQGAQIVLHGGIYTGNGSNHFMRMRGSAVALATIYPSVPQEVEWSRQNRIENAYITGFATALDLQSFTRETFINFCYIVGNTTAIKTTGKVVNVNVTASVLYSRVASSQALLVRGDATDTTWRYAEGIYLENSIADTSGTTLDLRDVFDFRFAGGQVNTAGATTVSITKGITPITQDLFFSDVLFNTGQFSIGTGLGTNFLFQAKITNCTFSGVANTAIATAAFTQGFTVSNTSFDTPSGTPVAVAIGASNVAINLRGLHIASTYTTKVTVDSTSVSGFDGEFDGTFTPGVAFGGAAVGVTYVTQTGQYHWNGKWIFGTFQIALSSKGSSVGAATITGLPAQASNNGTATVGKFSALNTAWTPILDITASTSVINIKNGAAGTEAVFTDANLANGSIINGSFMYQVATP